ncbi:MAG TPA: hypothetical protein VGE86_08500 [Thermoanaerobaculia bacterium]
MGTFPRRTALPRRLSILALVAAALLASPLFAVDLTGTYTGPFTAILDCGSVPSVSEGSGTLSLLQTGTAIRGTITLSFSNFGCAQKESFTAAAGLEGTVVENTFTATAKGPGLGIAQIVGGLEGETLSFVILGQEVRIFGVLPRSSSAPPSSSLTGAYSGSYTAMENVSDRCANMSTLTSSGSLAGNLAQVGSALSGQLVSQGAKVVKPDASRNCTVIDDPGAEVILISGTISGNSIVGFVGAADEDPDPFTATIDGTTISGSTQSQEGQTTFTIHRTSATPAPMILGFVADPAGIQPGKSTELRWATTDAAAVWLDQGIGARPATGSVRVSPSETTRYTLTAKGAGGTATANVTVTVTAAPAHVILSALPEGMLQRANQAGATDSYTLTNIGGAASSITLTQTGSFFTQSPAAFTLKPGASQTVTITALAQPAAVYTGSSNIAGDGVKADAAVRIVLLSAGSPAGTVDPRPEVRRKEFSAPAGQDPTGALSFTNRGAATLEAIAVSDAEWLVPQGGRVTIAPGQTVSVPFTIRRALRPDGAAPIGAAKARFGLLFFGAPFSSAGKTAMETTSATRTLVTIVDVVKPGTAAATPPPLAEGELAMFVPGMSSKSGETGDLLISSQSESAISDLKIYYSASGGTPSFLSGSVASLVANADVSFPGVVKNVFGKESETGTVQLRSTTLAEVAVSAIEADTSSETTPVVTALPVFRSDRGADAGSEVVLPGVEQSASATTALLIQEMTGSAATVQIDAFSANGQAVGSTRTETVGGFALLELTNAVPSGASTVRIRNASANASRIAAAAMVTDSASGDTWTVVDAVAGLPFDESLIVPLLGGLQRVNGAETKLLFLNGGASGATVSLERNATHPRRRPIQVRGTAGSQGPPAASATESLPAAPYQMVTSSSSDGTAGYALVSAASDVRSVGWLEFAPAAGSGRVGSALPAVPASSALRLGESRRFPGLEDASESTAAARTPVTYASDLLLVEAAGAETGVRVTVRFTYAVTTTLTSDIIAAADVTLAPNRFFIMRDVVAAVMGAQRSKYGDLSNVTLDVEVTSGDGAVIPFVQSIDNASRDVIVRTQ